jgi:L-alanine-DL-glutamate epimerase-like enolase superfamily enzyme
VTTDISIPICPVEEAMALAARYRSEGFTTIKTKIGLDLDEDVARLTAIHGAHPECALILDANEGFTADEALRFLGELRGAWIESALLEQPVARDDWDGLGRVTLEGGVAVLNIKIAKSGVVAVLEIATIAKATGLGLMIGGMVETRLGMRFAACLGGFDWIDLDTPLLLGEDPIEGGYVPTGADYALSGAMAGHGGSFAAVLDVM